MLKDEKMNLKLKGKNALVCGGSQGIGNAIAMKFAEMGANVTLVSRNEDSLKQALGKLNREFDQNHTFLRIDFSNSDEVFRVVNDYISSGTVINILVNNTGGPASGRIIDASCEQLMLAFTQHVLASQIITRAVVPGMIKSGFGRILNVISVGARQPIDNLGISNTIRGAMMSWSKTLSRELAANGITVNNLLPGYTNTNRLKELFEQRAKMSGKTFEQMNMDIVKDIPLNRFATPDEVGFAAAFLASKEAAYITGVSLPIDGGYLKCI